MPAIEGSKHRRTGNQEQRGSRCSKNKEIYTTKYTRVLKREQNSNIHAVFWRHWIWCPDLMEPISTPVSKRGKDSLHTLKNLFLAKLLTFDLEIWDIQPDCLSVRHWDYITTSAVEVRFQIRDQFCIPQKNYTRHVTWIFCETSKHAWLTMCRVLVFFRGL